MTARRRWPAPVAAIVVAIDAWQETDGKADLLALVERAFEALSEQLR